MDSSARPPSSNDAAQRYREVTALFDAIRDLPDAQARASIGQHPSAEVRGEVLEMLEADRRNESPLRTIVDVVGAIDEASAPSEIPTRIGDYSVTGLLGQGGGGVVLKGTCPKSGETVAIKVLGIGAWSSRALGRFRQEVKLLGHLSHPGIARILDAGTDRSGVSPHPYFVMEFVDGASLSAWRRAAPRTPREVVALFAEIVEAVAYSHARGITHRDLKPSNILVTTDGHPKILDFGVASVATGADPALDPLRTLTMMLQLGRTRHADGAAAGGSAGTAEGAVVGTLPYMSPEQISGTQTVDARSDLYALGVMMYEALCGRLPYDLSLRSLTDAALVIRSEIPTTIGRIDRSLRGDLEVMVSRLLEKRPVDRYQSAQELLEDLDRYLRGQRTRIRRIPMHVRAARFARRYPAYVAVSSFLALVALGSLGYAGYLVAEERFIAARRVESEVDAMRAELSAAAFAVGRGQPIAAIQALERIEESRRNWAWRAVDRHFGRGSLVSFVFYYPNELHACGNRVFVREAANGGHAAMYDLRGGTRKPLDVTAEDVALAVSPDGARMVRGFLSDGRLIVCSTEDGATLDVLASPLVQIDALAWSDDGSTLALANRRGELGAIDLASGDARRVETGWAQADGKVVDIRIVDHTVLAAIEGDGAIHAWRLPTLGGLGELRRIPLGEFTASRLDAARIDGALHAAVGTEQGAVALIEIERGEVERRLDFASSPIMAVAIEPRRGLVFAGCGERADRRVGTMQAWDLATGEPVGTLATRSWAVSVDFSDDGEMLFLGEAYGELRRISVERDLLAPAIGGPSMRVEHMAFAGDGRMVVSTAEGVFWWDWDRDRQASRVRLERWPLPSEAIAGRPFAVISVERDAPGGERRAMLAVVDRDTARVRFFDESGTAVGDAAIDALSSRDAPVSIAPTRRGFVVGAGRRIMSYAVLPSGTAVRAERIAATECEGTVRSVASTPEGDALVATIDGRGDANPQLIALTANGRGSMSQSWQRPLTRAKDGVLEVAAISADGGCAFAVWGANALGVFELALGANIFVAADFAPWNIDREAVALCMSPDDRALAVRFADGSVRIIEAGAAAEPKEPRP
ncbi:MAG: protein kinase [Phycisphaera sp.]|nr:protein kinase [Phycisphaera sp.]